MKNATIIFIFTYMGRLPVKPSQETLGGTDQLHHRGKEVVGWLAWRTAIIRGTFPAVRRGHVKAVGGCSHPHNQGLQVVRLYTIVLKQRFKHTTDQKADTADMMSQSNNLFTLSRHGGVAITSQQWSLILRKTCCFLLNDGAVIISLTYTGWSTCSRLCCEICPPVLRSVSGFARRLRTCHHLIIMKQSKVCSVDRASLAV